MSLSKESIWFNYQQAISKADELDEIADSMRRMSARELEDGMSYAADSWSGDSSRQFLAKGARLQDEICVTARGLSDTAESVRVVAKRILEAELANLEIIKQQSS